MSKQALGVLILHGFTGSLDTVKAVVPVAEELGLPYRMPVMRGHGTRFEDLNGVRADDWYTDAREALLDLLNEVESVVVVGLSMGGLVALNLGIEFRRQLKGLILLAPALRYCDPMSALTPLLCVLFKYWNTPSGFNDKQLERERCTNYKRFPTRAYQELLNYSIRTEKRLKEVLLPTRVIYSMKDTIVSPTILNVLKSGLGTKDQHYDIFERSGHELLQDNEAEAVLAVVKKHLLALQFV